MTTRSGRPLCVLVVDNVPDAADSLVVLLEIRGYRVLTAYDGPDALRVAAADPPDAVVTDLVMPGMDGWELARRLREQAAGKPPFVVAVTGLDRGDSRDRSKEASIDMHLVKPVDPDELVAVLERLR